MRLIVTLVIICIVATLEASIAYKDIDPFSNSTTTTPYNKTTAPYNKTTTPYYKTTTPSGCPLPYNEVGGRCVFADPILHATWGEARYVCQMAGGDLVVLDSTGFFWELIKYLRANELLEMHKYWVGGRVAPDNVWEWVSGSEIALGSRVWSLQRDYDENDYFQDPSDADISSCAYLSPYRFHYMSNTNCTATLASICQLPTWDVAKEKKMTKDSSIKRGKSKSQEETKAITCPHPYAAIGDRCAFVDPLLDATWHEARYICGLAGGDLAIMDSMEFYEELVQYIYNNGLQRHHYWIGGERNISQYIWEWVDGSQVDMGTPLWALSGSSYDYYEVYNQEPLSEKWVPYCGCLDRERFFFMDDNDCDHLKAAICQLPTTWKESVEGRILKNMKQISQERYKEIIDIRERKRARDDEYE